MNAEREADPVLDEGTATIRWENAGLARVLEARADQVVLRSTVPYPPGAPVNGTLQSDAEGVPSHAFTVKVTGSKRVRDGEWDVKGRLVTAPTLVRAAFERSAARARTAT